MSAPLPAFVSLSNIVNEGGDLAQLTLLQRSYEDNRAIEEKAKRYVNAYTSIKSKIIEKVTRISEIQAEVEKLTQASDGTDESLDLIIEGVQQEMEELEAELEGFTAEEEGLMEEMQNFYKSFLHSAPKPKNSDGQVNDRNLIRKGLLELPFYLYCDSLWVHLDAEPTDEEKKELFDRAIIKALRNDAGYTNNVALEELREAYNFYLQRKDYTELLGWLHYKDIMTLSETQTVLSELE